MEVVHATHGLAAQAHQHVPLPHTRVLRGAAGFHAQHQDAARRVDPLLAHAHAPERHVLPRHADPAAPHAPFLDELGGDVLRGVDPDGEAQALGRQDHRRVDADHLAARVGQWAARVARVDRRVGLNHLVEQAAVPRAERAAEGAHDARGHGALEAERVTDRDEELTHPECA